MVATALTAAMMLPAVANAQADRHTALPPSSLRADGQASHVLVGSRNRRWPATTIPLTPATTATSATIRINTPTTTLTGVGLASHPDGAPTDFTVRTWDGAQWTTRATVSGNSSLHRWIPFSTPVTTSQVRVVVTAGVGAFSRITELTP